MSVKRFRYFVIFIVLVLSLPIPAFAHSLDQMAAGLNVLRVEMDGQPLCKTESETLNRLPQLLQARIDAVLLGSKEAKLAYLETCESRCRCGFYLDWLTKNDPKNSVLPTLEQKAKKLNSKQALACAKKNIWFCKSNLLQELKKEADL